LRRKDEQTCAGFEACLTKQTHDPAQASFGHTYTFTKNGTFGRVHHANRLRFHLTTDGAGALTPPYVCAAQLLWLPE
jgi:hypothetical protein